MATGVLAAMGLTATLAACGGGADHPGAGASHPPSASPSTPAPTKHVSLTLGVYGSPGEVKAFSRVAAEYRAVDADVSVTVKSWPNETAMATALAHGAPAPDVFLTPRSQVRELTDLDVIQPVDTFLEARNVDLGDSYSRAAILGFSQDNHLTCMPYAISPEVLYVNTDLVNFKAMARRGLPVPSNPQNGTWNLQQFVAAMRYAASRPGVAGTYLTPTLRGLAPWLTAAGGHLVDDVNNPTTTSFSDSEDALKALQPLLSDPQLRLSPKQLKSRSPLTWFLRGKLAALPGQRSLVPVLRGRPGLHWNVMAMPANGGAATTGDYSGLCLSKTTDDADAAADFLVYLNSTEAVTDVAQSGYIVPVNQQVAYGSGFVQPGRAPADAAVFTNAIKGMTTLPPASTLSELQRVTAAPLRRLFQPGADLDAVAQRIDTLSSERLRPPAPSGASSPSGGPTP